MKHIGDITKIDGAAIEAVDVITGGSPFQDLSVAGKRAGLAGERSGLFMDMVRVIKEMRDATKQLHMQRPDVNIRPRFVVWENVYGAFNSNGGEDFRAVLEEFSKLAAETDVSIPRPTDGKWSKSGCIVGDQWSLAWRGMDACKWGVPQRRKRIALVVDLAGQSAPEILFERSRVPGDTEQGGTEREETPGTTVPSIENTSYTLKIRGGVEVDSKGRKAGKGALIQTELSGTLGVSQDQTLITINEPLGVDFYNQRITGYKTKTLTSISPDADHVPCVYGISAFDSNAMRSKNPESGIYVADTSRTLDLNGGNPACNQGGMIVLEKNGSPQNAICVDQGAGKSSVSVYEEVAPTLATTHDGAPVVSCDVFHLTSEKDMAHTLKARDYKDPQILVPSSDQPRDYVKAYGLDRASFNQGKNVKYDFSVEEEKIGALTARGPGAVSADSQQTYQNNTGALMASGYQKLGTQEAANDMYVAGNGSFGHAVRRLTPLECERLQGFPDGWTDIPGASDAARYKALGNSIALPQWRFVLGNISKYLPKRATLGSLFDGIGGFPLVWEEIHGAGTARWASEIEKFPIEVTKYRFPEEDTDGQNNRIHLHEDNGDPRQQEPFSIAENSGIQHSV